MEKGTCLYFYCSVLELSLLRVCHQSSRRKFLNCWSKNLPVSKASKYPVAEKQAGFPTNPEDQEIGNQQIENAEDAKNRLSNQSCRAANQNCKRTEIKKQWCRLHTLGKH